MVLCHENGGVFPNRHPSTSAYNLNPFAYPGQQTQYPSDFAQFQVSPLGAETPALQQAQWASAGMYGVAAPPSRHSPPGAGFEDWVPAGGISMAASNTTQAVQGYAPYRPASVMNLDYPQDSVSASSSLDTGSHQGLVAINSNGVSSPCSPCQTNPGSRQLRPPYDWMKKQSYQTAQNTGKTRTKDKYRVVYSDHQRLELEKEFHYSRYITIRRKSELAQMLELSERQVKIWFQNRRAKERKQNKKREESKSPPKAGAADTRPHHLLISPQSGTLSPPTPTNALSETQ